MELHLLKLENTNSGREVYAYASEYQIFSLWCFIVSIASECFARGPDLRIGEAQRKFPGR